MKGKLFVVFHSNHGYVKRYVDIIGNTFGCDAVPADKLRGEMLGGYDKILYIGSLKNEEINGLKKFAQYYDAIYKKLVICGVGLTPFHSGMPARIKESSVSVAYEKFIPVFYVQGGFDYNELSRTEKFSVSLRLKQISMSNIVNDDDKFFAETTKHPIDEVKKENIQPLIDFLDGKSVDPSLYSPPEITDPEEEKKFFDDLRAAATAPENKKRDLKKRLKGGIKRSARTGESDGQTPEDKTPDEQTPAPEEAEKQPDAGDSAEQSEPEVKTDGGDSDTSETAPESEKAE